MGAEKRVSDMEGGETHQLQMTKLQEVRGERTGQDRTILSHSFL